jgi:hypothetical protein
MSNADTHDRTKRIPKSLDTEANLVGSYSITDLTVAIAPGAAILLGARMVLPETRVLGYSLQALALPLAALGLLLGVVFVSVTPRYVSSMTWLSALAAYTTSAPDAAHQDAQAYTQVQRVFPEHEAIERTDGALVGALQVSPASMALATDAEWAQAASGFEDLLNTTVRFPIQLYSTTRPFPVDAYLERYEQRLEDPDVRSNPTLQRCIEEYVEWYRSDLERRQMTIRDHYVIVPVRPESVRHTDAGLAQRLSDVPMLGVFVETLTASRVAEERAAMAEELDDRLRSLERGIRGLDGCEATRLPAASLVELVGEFWTDRDREVGEAETAVRTSPLVTGPER